MCDHHDITRTIAEYCPLIDDGHYDEWSQLFVDDAVLTGNGQTLGSGRVAIREWIEGRVPTAADRGKHLTTNTVLHVSDDEAEASSDWIFMRPTSKGPVITSSGRYIDRLVRQHDRWRFVGRDIVIDEGWARTRPLADIETD